jgi:integrase/recombinase XerC
MAALRLKSIKPAQWPERDRRLWAAARQPPEDIDDGGLAAGWRPATIFNCEFFYGQYLRYLELGGRLDPDSDPLQRTRMDWVREFIKAYEPGHAETSCAQVLVSLAFLIRACHPPDGNLELTWYAYRRQERAKPCRPKITRMASIAELIDLGEHLMQKGRQRLYERERRGAVEFRDGLMIAMLTAHPIRRKNFASLQIGRTLILEGDRLVVRIGGDETKNRWEIERVYPAFIVPFVQEYIRIVRKFLLEGSGEPDEGYLWIGRGGTHLVPGVILNAVKKRTSTYLEKAVPIHLFRDSVATDIAVNDPQNVGIARVVLGHRTYDTTQNCYILAESSSAFARYQDAIQRRRSKHGLRDLLK